MLCVISVCWHACTMCMYCSVARAGCRKHCLPLQWIGSRGGSAVLLAVVESWLLHMNDIGFFDVKAKVVSVVGNDLEGYHITKGLPWSVVGYIAHQVRMLGHAL